MIYTVAWASRLEITILKHEVENCAFFVMLLALLCCIVINNNNNNNNNNFTELLLTAGDSSRLFSKRLLFRLTVFCLFTVSSKNTLVYFILTVSNSNEHPVTCTAQRAIYASFHLTWYFYCRAKARPCMCTCGVDTYLAFVLGLITAIGLKFTTDLQCL